MMNGEYFNGEYFNGEYFNYSPFTIKERKLNNIAD
jgi:hypothetical protein